ncbi:PREDICTED: uncharacterized protein LOC109157286 [Ipomoea nil]|uniref:uncharacterized protein LOC109157286 n=1 Tax=Ipomoea nil TaxID=35883 RepID=UPI0009010ED8|nr:PREDICTED: uncharacterized protein LOC109157286 [Ipomoea nil]
MSYCWCIWNNRNDLVWNSQPWNSVRNEATSLVMDWLGSIEGGGLGLITSNNPNTVPIHNADSVSVFVDAGIFSDTGEAYYDIFVQDGNGTFAGAKNGHVKCLNDAHLEEALAIREALSWLKDRGFNRVAVLSDCQMVCRFLNGTSQDLSYAGCVLRECRDLKRHFESVSFQFVSRSVNKVAQALTRAMRSQTGPNCWLFSVPSCIEHLL